MNMGSNEIKNDLMAYLYNEMSSEERIRFEQLMDSDPELKKEYVDLKKIRKGLSGLEEKEIMEPFYLWGRNGIRNWLVSAKRKNWAIYRPVVAVAASIVLILIAGYLTDFSISYRQDSLIIGFNKDLEQHPENTLSQAEITDLIKNEIARNNAMILTRLESGENDLDTRVTSIENWQKANDKIRNAGNTFSEKEMQAYFEQIRNTNARLIENFVKSATVQQQEYFQAMLAQFNDYMQEQRSEDLRIIRRSLVNLKENQDKQQQETQQILATLISNSSISNN